MTVFVHLVEGDSPTDRMTRITQLASASCRPMLVFAETAKPPTSALDWLIGPGCTCCLPARHPRLRLSRAAAQPGPVRIVIDAGPPAVADRIIAALRSLPQPLLVNVQTV